MRLAIAVIAFDYRGIYRDLIDTVTHADVTRSRMRLLRPDELAPGL